MARNNLDIEKLRDNELAGAKTINPMVDWARALASTSDYLYLSNNAYGGVNLDVDFTLLVYNILRLVERIAADFKATISGSRLTVASGCILLPGETHSIPQYTRSLSSGDDGRTVCITTDASDSAGGTPAWEHEISSFPAGIVSGSVVRLPICTVSRTGGAWGVTQHHLGAFVFAVPPAPLIAGYDASRMQSLDHGAGGALAWTTYGRCN